MPVTQFDNSPSIVPREDVSLDPKVVAQRFRAALDDADEALRRFSAVAAQIARDIPEE